MSSPLLSIIITVLNGEATLRRCLSSLANQTFTDFEVVVIDGGSTDATHAILDVYQSILPLSWWVIPQIGLYAGMNYGINQAKGHWFYFMGCDDELFNCETLTSVAHSLLRTPARFVTGSVLYATQDVVIPAYCGSPYTLQWAIHHQGTIYHHTIFNTFRYDDQLKISADYELNMLLAINQVTYQQIDDVIAIYGEGGISSREPLLGFTEVRQVHRRIFRPPILWWVQTFCFLQQRSWFWRKKWGLNHLKLKIRQWRKGSLVPQTRNTAYENRRSDHAR